MAGTGTNQPQPQASDFTRGLVTNPDQSEVTRQGLFDSLLYLAAGQTQLSFFAQPIGQGKTTEPGATAATPKTGWDTNLQIGSTLPSGKAQQIQGIELFFWAGSVSTADTYTPVNPSLFAAADAASVAAQVSDVYTFYNAGRLQFGQLDKTYIDEAPLGLFPPSVATTGSFAVATTSATASEIGVVLTRQSGTPYQIGIPLTLEATQNFYLNLIWPALLAMPSTNNGRVKCRLEGYVARATQ